MLRAILYAEIEEGATATLERLEHLSLGNCLQLLRSFSSNEAVIRVECNDANSLSQAITDLCAVEGVKRITTCVVIKD